MNMNFEQLVGSSEKRLSSICGEQVRRGMQEAAERGQVVSFVPLGYDICWEKNGRRYVAADRDRLALIEEAFRLVSTGMGITHVYKRMVAAGLKGKNGKPVNRSSLGLILRNPFYTGWFQFRGKLYQGQHEAIISRTLFDSVQRSLRKRRSS
jgi:site-specific DNA recombinase